MSDAPEKLFCWNFQTKEGGWEKGWGGYCRQSNLRPLDDREVKTGALYVRADRIEELEAKLAKALEALETIAFECTGEEAAYTARTTLAELTGGKDE